MGKGIHLQGILPDMVVPGNQAQAQSQRLRVFGPSPIAFHAESILTSQAIQKKLTHDQHERDVR